MSVESTFIKAVAQLNPASQDMQPAIAKMEQWLADLGQTTVAQALSCTALAEQGTLAHSARQLNQQLQEQQEAWAASWSALAPAQELADRFRDRIMLLVFGSFNAGKSSLCNFLADRFRRQGHSVDFFRLADGQMQPMPEGFQEGATETTVALQGVCLGEKLVLFIPWFEYHYRWPYTQFIERVVGTAKKYHLPVIASETNGVGQYPTTMLDDKMTEAGFYSAVAPVVTDVKRKQTGFGMIKGLLQAKRLVLPRDPELLKQLRGLEFEQLPGGSLRIAVPDRVGHDDVAMSFMQAISSIRLAGAVRDGGGFGESQLVPADTEVVQTPSGVKVPVNARPVSFHRDAFSYPKGSESGEGW